VAAPAPNMATLPVTGSFKC